MGIDTQFISVTNYLKGLRKIPPGLHLLHCSDSLETGSSIRFGRWITCDEGQILRVSWDEEGTRLATEESVPQDFGDIYQFMVDYPESEQRWKLLTRFIDQEVLEEYLPEGLTSISTATPSREENMVLLDILLRKQPILAFEDQTHKELTYTIIERKMRRETDASRSEVHVTEDALDRSWQVESLFGSDPELLLGELQLSFVHFIVLGNLSSYTQWMNLLWLVLKSRRFLSGLEPFTQSFIGALVLQLEVLPSEYFADSLDTQVVDMADYTEAMESLAGVLDQSPLWHKLHEVNLRRFGMYFSRSTFDQDNFEVYNIEGHDEDDEDAPAIVS